MSEPRAYTKDECREHFLKQVAVYVKYWFNETTQPGTLEKLNGLAFSIMVILDGGAMSLPGFLVTPNPAPEDEEYSKDNGDNWWPSGVDIAGSLHDN